MKQTYDIKRKLKEIFKENCSNKDFRKFCKPFIKRYTIKYLKSPLSCEEIKASVIDGLSDIILGSNYQDSRNISGRVGNKITQHIEKILKEKISTNLTKDSTNQSFYELNLEKTPREIIDEVTKYYHGPYGHPIHKDYKIASYFYGLGTPSVIKDGKIVQEKTELDYSKPHSLQETLKAFFPKDNREFLVKDRLKHFNQRIKNSIERQDNNKFD
jgi:hypothetical protein